MKGIIFDFNGTLLWDTPLHEKAWNLMAEKYTGRSLSPQEIAQNILGRTNENILTWLLGYQPASDVTSRLASEKEEMYRNLCIEMKDDFRLAPGAADLLNWLKENNVPRAIATSSGIENVEFYIRVFRLTDWFDENHIIFDRGLFPGKPAPDIYMHAIQTLNLPASDCIVVEDAIPGVEAARTAGAGTIFVIHESGELNGIHTGEGVTRIIRNFHEITPADLE